MCEVRGGWLDVKMEREQRDVKTKEYEQYKDEWEKCPDYVGNVYKYITDEKNLKIATKISNDYYGCTIIGNTYIPS